MSLQVRIALLIAGTMLASAAHGSQAQERLGQRPPASEQEAAPRPAGLSIAAARGPQPDPRPMPPHPSVLARIRAEGYDSVSIVNLRRAAERKGIRGIDQPAPLFAPVTGTRPALVLLVDYSDLTHDAGSTPSVYDSLLFSVGTYPAPGSMRDFYQEASYGLFDISPSLVDGAWRQSASAHNYYADADGIPGTSDDYGWGSYPQNAQKLVVDAVALADPYVDFSSYATGGQVQGLFVIHAGPGAETDPSHEDWIWSHMWALNENAVTVDGVTVNLYSMEPEYTWSAGDSTVGIFCHEYGHVLGLPDLYDTDYSSEGLGNWSLMAGGSWNGSSGTSPAHPDAWCKIELGWIDPVVQTTNETGASIPRVEDNAVAYQLWTNGAIGTEYFLLENRQPVGFDSALDGDGLLLYHVDEMAYQTNDWHPMVMVEQADGYWDLQYAYNSGDAGDPYPGTSDNRTADSNTTPDTRSYAGAETGVSIQTISDSAATMTADLSVQDGLASQVLLEVHPNERAPGSSTGQVIGVAPWARPGPTQPSMYWWKHHRFVGSDALWIQVCAQNWNAIQNGTGDDDNIRMRIDGFVPVDYDLIQNGPWGAYQWRGDKEHGHRWTLRFLYLGASPLPVLHALQFEADETPVIWWIKVTDLEPEAIEAF
jgi:immune inhibitor A